MPRTNITAFLLVLCFVATVNCASLLRVAFGWPYDICDYTRTYQQDTGRLWVRWVYEQYIRTFTVTSGQTAFPTEKIENLILHDNYTLIVGSGTTAIPAMWNLSLNYPHVRFFVDSAYKISPNFVSVYIKAYEVRYLAGILAGLQTQSNIIGFVGGQPTSDVYSAVNAFALGVKQSNPSAVVKLVFMGTWRDQRLEQQATEQLVKEGADIITMFGGSWLIPQTAKRLGAKVIGYYSDTRAFLGDEAITSVEYIMGALYDWLISQVLNGTWPQTIRSFGILDGAVRLSPFSELVTDEQAAVVNAEQAKLMSYGGAEYVFCGDAVADHDPENGTCLSLTQIMSMNYTLHEVHVLPGKFYFTDITTDIADTQGIVLAALGGVMTLCNIVFLIALVIYQSTPVFRYASLPFCYLMIGGGFISNIAYFMWLLTPSSNICVARLWLTSIAYILVVASVLLKNYRIWRIFSGAQKMIIITITNQQLVVGVGIAVALQVIFLLVWSSVDPLKETQVQTSDTNFDEVYVECSCSNINTYRAILYTYNLLGVLVGTFLAWKTRRVQSFFNESLMLGMIMYNISLMAIILLPLIYIFQNEFTALYAVQALAVGYLSTSTMSFIFVPKMWIAIMHPEQNVSMHDSSPHNTSVAKTSDTQGNSVNSQNSVPATL